MVKGVIITDIKVELLEETSEQYIRISEDEAALYENPNANDILFIPEAVQQVADSEIFFSNLMKYDLDDIAYVEEELNYSIEQSDFAITEVDFTNNKITAHVTADSHGFVMFSQCYYPGWRVYVDGERTKLYKVSETIMGAELPAGEYDIQFVYVPIYLIIGAIVTLLTSVFCVLYVICSNRKVLNCKGEKHVE